MLVNKCLSSNKQELILIKFNYSNNYYYLNKLATYVYTTYVCIYIYFFQRHNIYYCTKTTLVYAIIVNINIATEAELVGLVGDII